MIRKIHLAVPLLVLLLAVGALFNAAHASPDLAPAVPISQVNRMTTENSVAQQAGTETIYLPFVTKPQDSAWPMAAANLQRTSWTSEEVRGSLRIQWYKPFEAYIAPKIQIIAAHSTLYVSTARGLYALNAGDGAEKWVYPTELPLGHSPTIHQGVAYVGGHDRRLHAIDAFNGQGLWTFQAGGGFDTNPLVVGDKVFAGNRDGSFYAVYISGPNTGQLAWKYDTGGPILFSAAYRDGVLYFASNDSHAYALNAQNGSLVWKSAKLPGAGFHSWWPVIYQDYVIFAGSNNYPTRSELGPGPMHALEKMEIFPNYQSDSRGILVGPLNTASGSWVAGTPTIDTRQPTVTGNGSTTPILTYFEQKPWRRTYLVLQRSNGQEFTTDFDNDGQPEYAPILWFGARGAGNRYPPVIGSDGVLYQSNMYLSDPWIPGGQVSGWDFGSPYISVIMSGWAAFDEPRAYSAGGNLIYWNLCCDRAAGAVDISTPNTTFLNRYNAGILPPTGGGGGGRAWSYFSYDLEDKIPGYSSYYWNDTSPYGGFGGPNGLYGFHGDQNPPIPYQGQVYMHRGNSIIAFGPDNVNPLTLPTAQVVDVQDNLPAVPTASLQTRLEEEVQKILDAGHLRPGHYSTGLFDNRGRFECGDELTDYFHSPGDSIYALTRALPHLPSGMQQQTRTYLQSEFNTFPPSQYNHIGYQDGASREYHDFPPEVEAQFATMGPQSQNFTFDGWGYAPHNFYALWKYAEEFGGAQTIFNNSKNKLSSPPSNSLLAEMPHVHNAFIAGYYGYLQLEALAGFPPDTSVQSQLDNLLSLRASTFTLDAPDEYFNVFQKYYCRTLTVSRNFMYMVPELAEYLRQNALNDVVAALDAYDDLAPYWFVTKVETAFGEGILSPPYDTHSIFHARAWILQEPYAELSKYLDVPAFYRGDLFYLHNLITALEAN